MVGIAVTFGAAVVFFMWAVLGHSTEAERQATLDASCPVQQKIIKYPVEMGGPHLAICNPTGQTWRN